MKDSNPFLREKYFLYKKHANKCVTNPQKG